MVKKWNYRAERVKYSLFWLRFPEVMEFSIKRSVAQLLCPVFQYKSRPPCGAVWSGLSGREKRGRSKVKGGGQEAEGRRGRRKALVKLDLCEAFLPWYKSNNRGSGVRFSAFFYEWSLPPAKTTYSPRSDSFFFFFFLLRGSLKTSVERRGLLVIIFVFLTFPFPFLVLLAEKRAGEDFHSPLS